MKKSATSNKSGATHIANVASFDSGFSLAMAMLVGAGVIGLVDMVAVSVGYEKISVCVPKPEKC
jgi:hypothetical protein